MLRNKRFLRPPYQIRIRRSGIACVCLMIAKNGSRLHPGQDGPAGKLDAARPRGDNARARQAETGGSARGDKDKVTQV